MSEKIREIKEAFKTAFSKVKYDASQTPNRIKANLEKEVVKCQKKQGVKRCKTCPDFGFCRLKKWRNE